LQAGLGTAMPNENPSGLAKVLTLTYAAGAKVHGEEMSYGC